MATFDEALRSLIARAWVCRRDGVHDPADDGFCRDCGDLVDPHSFGFTIDKDDWLREDPT